MSAEDARALLVAARPDLKASVHAGALDAIAVHLGYHALALAYAAAALARRPLKTPQAILTSMTEADIGDKANILSEFTEQDLGISSKGGLAQSLGLLLDELTEAGSEGHDPLALTLANLMAFCNPAAIPVNLLVAASGAPEATVDKSLRALHQRSIITLSYAAGMHRLTQSLLRGRLKQHSGPGFQPTLARLLTALIDLFRWPGSPAEELLDHTKTPVRVATLPHAESVLAHAPTSAEIARLHAEMAHRLKELGQLVSATTHINASIAWNEAQSPRNERDLASCYASRAKIRLDRGDLAGADDDIKKSIDWFADQSPCDERSLALLYASRASIRQLRGDLAGAEADIKKSIDWEESQTLPNERGLAIYYASRASIRQNRGDLAGAEADIKKSIDWYEAQSPRDEPSLAIGYTTRAGIRRDVASRARTAGDAAAATAGFKAARADIDAALTWYLANQPSDERALAIVHKTKASIDAAERGD